MTAGGPTTKGTNSTIFLGAHGTTSFARTMDVVFGAVDVLYEVVPV
jgi:hypothetical protein